MKKELLEMLDELNETLEDLLKDNNDILTDRINEAMKDKASISIEKDSNGGANVNIEGERLAILVALAGLEETVLRKLHTPVSVWKTIKEITGIMEVNDNE